MKAILLALALSSHAHAARTPDPVDDPVQLKPDTTMPSPEGFLVELEDGTQLLIKSPVATEENDFSAELDHNPELKIAVAAIFEKEDAYRDDDYPSREASNGRRRGGPVLRRQRYTNRGILGPKGAWPIAKGACATVNGEASFYGGGEKLKPLRADGTRFNTNSLAAAHRTLPIGTRVTVTNLANGKVVSNVIINDRGPAIETGRELDVTSAVAKQLDFIRQGHTKITFRFCRG